MIGHKILLTSGDSSSRVLPIIEEKGRYKIEFGAEIQFDPSDLVKTVNQAAKETNLGESFIVEMVSCDSGKVVYSYEKGESKQTDIIPCGGRLQPKECLNLLFTLLDSKGNPLMSESKASSSKSSPKIILMLLAIPLVLLAFLWFFIKKRSKKDKNNPNLIQLGNFQFDKLNMTLLLKDHKIELTSKESDLLHLLYKDVNSTVEKEVLLSNIWGDEGDYVGRTLDVFISKLRKKLEFDPKVKIVNIRGVGYKLIMDNKSVS